MTGASSGIGLATALHLRELGHHVYGAARRQDRMQPLSLRGGVPLLLDVTDDASLRAAVERIRAESGRIDVLVNNAGYGSYGAVEDVPLDEARRQFEVNLFGLARLVQLVLPTMRAQGSGTIVNISSIGGKVYTPLGAWYHATKHAVEGFSDALRFELADHGVRVVVVEPGAIATEWGGIAIEGMVERSGGGPYAALVRRTKAWFEREFQRGSSPEVVARAVGRAVTARRPKPRYAVGSGARLALFGRWLLSDRGFDRVLRFYLR